MAQATRMTSAKQRSLALVAALLFGAVALTTRG
jgi:hypothetical protein